MSNIIDFQAEREKRKPIYGASRLGAAHQARQEQRTQMFEAWLFAITNRDKPDGAA